MSGGGRKWLGALVVLAAAMAPSPAAEAITPLSEYGIGGSDGPGEFAGATHVAVDPQSGDVYATDESNNRVMVFARDGTFLRAWGKDVVPGGPTGPEVCTTSCQFGDDGGAAGELDGAQGIAISPAGEVFVSEYAGNRISVFTREGQFVRAFGRGVAGGFGYGICTTACFTGLPLAAAGGMDNPQGMAIAPSGDLYVVDNDNHRVDVFRQSGEFVRSFGAGVDTGAAAFETCTATSGCQIGVVANVPGSLDAPRAVDFDPDGNLWVADGSTHSVSGFTTEPGFLRAFGRDVVPGPPDAPEVCTTSCKAGVAGPGAGTLTTPSGVAVSAAGEIHVAEGGNNRVSVFDTSGAFLRAFGDDVIPGEPFEFEICTTSCQTGDDDLDPGAFDLAKGMDFDCRGALYVGDDFSGRVTRFGEPGLRLPPCPSNEFEIGKVKRKKKRGTAVAPVTVPGPGELVLASRKLKDVERHAEAAGEQRLKLKAEGRAKKRLKKKGKLKVKLEITYTPDEGDPLTKPKKTKLVRKRR